MKPTHPAGFEDFGTVLSAVPMNGAAATLTATLTGLKKQFSRVYLFISYTYSAATSVVFTPTSSPDGDTFVAYGAIAVTGAAGAVSVGYADTVTGTASFTTTLDYNIAGRDSFKLVVSGGGTPGAGDLITVRAVVVA